MTLRLRTTPQILKILNEKLPDHDYDLSFPIALLSSPALGLQNLHELLHGTSVYIPSKPVQEINQAHEARMNALRTQLEEREYQSIIATDAHSSLAETSSELRLVKNQLSTIINVLISIFTAAMATWYWTPYWTTGNRVLASFATSIALGCIEAFLYFRYLVKIEQSKRYDATRPSQSVVKRTVQSEKESKKNQ